MFWRPARDVNNTGMAAVVGAKTRWLSTKGETGALAGVAAAAAVRTVVQRRADGERTLWRVQAGRRMLKILVAWCYGKHED